MTNEIILNIESKEIRFAMLHNGILQDLIIERKKNRQITGNIYRGKVTNILHNIQSAFIDIAEEENGFIHISDIVENTKKFEQQFDMDFNMEVVSPNTAQPNMDIEQVLKKDQPVLVQVIKEPIGTKGARLTSNISLGGRYLVLLPNSSHRGVSRKIENRSVRDHLQKLIQSFEMPHNMGLICRTASANAAIETLIQEAHDLLDIWQGIVEKFHQSSIPTLLYEESDLIKKAVTTALDKQVDRLLIDDYSTYVKCKRLHTLYQGSVDVKIELYRDKKPIFERFNIEKEIDKALRRKVWLSCGGYLFFDKTEAMCTIDVNSGKSQTVEDSVEEALVQINITAACEIARQLRLRNIGGLIIIDFIDMRFKKNQKRVLDALKAAMKEDHAKSTVLSMSEFGLVELTRQRHRESLNQIMCTHCPYCHGHGMIKNFETTVIEIERSLHKAIGSLEQFGLQLLVHPHLAVYMKQEGDDEFLMNLAEQMKAHLTIDEKDDLHINDFQLYSTVSNCLLEV